MDGVLADTGEVHYQSWLKTLAGAGILFDRETFRRTFGMNNAGLLEFTLGYPLEPDRLQEISERKEATFRQEIRGRVKLFPGAREWLERLAGSGIRQAVASSAPLENIEVLVDELGIRQYFDVLVSAYKMPGKPDPAVFLEAARRLDMPPEACLVVEDSIAGVEAARRAGMRCIAVTNTNPREALQEADVIVETLVELGKEALTWQG
jgi:HAD superfamily hydrolase (TIGR01509 family)